MPLPNRVEPHGMYDMVSTSSEAAHLRPDASPVQGSGRTSSSESVYNRETAGMSTRELQRVAKARSSIMLPSTFDVFAHEHEDGTMIRSRSPVSIGDEHESLEGIAPADRRRARPQTDYASERPLAAVNRFSRSFDSQPIIRSPSALQVGQLDISDPWGLTWDSSSPYDALAVYLQPKRSSMALGGRRPSSIASSPAESTSPYPWSSPSASTSTSNSHAPSAASSLAAPVIGDRRPSADGLSYISASTVPSSASTTQQLSASPPLHQQPQMAQAPGSRRRVASYGAVETLNRATANGGARTRSKLDVETRPDPDTPPTIQPKRSRTLLSLFSHSHRLEPSSSSATSKMPCSRSSRGSIFTVGAPPPSIPSTRSTSPSAGHSHPGRAVSEGTALQTPSVHLQSGAEGSPRKSRSSLSLLFFRSRSGSSDSVPTRGSLSTPATPVKPSAALPPASISNRSTRSMPRWRGGSTLNLSGSISALSFGSLKRRDSATPPAPPAKVGLPIAATAASSRAIPSSR